MSTEVEQRVVEMQFDNARFEKNASTTLSTLDKLKQKLNFSGASKGLEDVSAAAEKVNMTKLGNGVETVMLKFSALQTMGVTALANITNSAINAGKRIASALTIDPIKTGFSEYETQINAIQTILSNTQSKGTTLDDVNQALDRLNAYADKTIYNFTQMTKNIGTFTAAGIDLETSVKSIQGIANLAAISGSNAQQASTAMYQLSQALASGTVKLMDWNSVVNAGMGGQVFQDALKETARVHGIAVDEIIEKSGSFRESLSKGWLSAEVLNETLEKFTLTTEGLTDAQIEQNRQMLKAKGYTEEQIDAIFELGKNATDAATKVKTFTQLWETLQEAAQSGWTQTWELIVGDFEQSKKLLTGISDYIGNIINDSSAARNSLIKGALTSKWDQLIEKINAAGVTTEQFETTVKKVAKRWNINLEALIKQHGSLYDVIKAGKLPVKLIGVALGEFVHAGDDAAATTETITEKLEYFKDMVSRVVEGEFGNGADRVKALTEAGHDYAQIQELVNQCWRDGKLDLSAITEEQLRNMGFTEQQTATLKDLAKQADETGISIDELIKDLEKPSGRELLLDSLRNLVEALVKPLTAVKEAWDKTFPAMDSDTLYNIIEKFHEFTESLIITDEAAANLKTVFEGLFAGFQLGGTLLSRTFLSAIKVADAVLSLFGTDMMEVAAHIAEYIIQLRDWVKEHTLLIDVYNKAAKVIVTFITGIEKCVKAFLGLDVVSNTIKRLGDMLAGFFGDITAGFDSVGIDGFCDRLEQMFNDLEAWIKGLNNVENLGKAILDGIIAGIQNGAKYLVDCLRSLASFGTDTINGVWGGDSIAKNILLGIVNGLADGVGTVITAIADIAVAIIKGFCDILEIHSPSKIFFTLAGFVIAGLAAGLLAGTPEVEAAIGNISKAITDFFKGDTVSVDSGGLVDTLVNVIKAVVDKVVEIIKDLDLGMILSTGLGIGMLVTVNKVADVVGMFASPFAELGKGFKTVATSFKELTGAIKDNMKAKTWEKVGKVVLNMALSIAILAASLFVLTKLAKEDTLWPAIGALAAIAAIVGVLAGVAALMEKFGDPTKGALGIAGVSASLLIMAIALKQLSGIKIEDPESIAKMMVAMATCIALLTFISGASGEHASQVGNMLLKMSVALLILVGVIKLMGMLKYDDIQKGILVLSMLGAAFIVIEAVSILAGKHASKVGSMLLKMGVAILLLVGVIKLIGLLRDDEIVRGGAVVVALGLLFGALTMMSHLAGANAGKAGTMILMMSLALGMLVFVIKQISKLSDSEVKRGTSVVMKIGVLFAVVIAASALAGEHAIAAGTMLLSMAGALLILTGVVYLIGKIPESDLKRGVGAVLMLELMFAVLIASTSKAQKCVGMLVMLSVILTMLVISIGILSGIANSNPEGLKNAVGAISAVMLALSVLVASTKFAGDWKSLLGLVAVLAVAAGAMAIILGDLSGIQNPEGAIKSAEALSILLIAFSAAMVVLSKAGTIGKDAWAAMGILTAVIAGLAIILGVMAALGLEASLNNAVVLGVLLNAMTAALVIMGTVKRMSKTARDGMITLGIVVAELAIILGVMAALHIEASMNNALALGVLLNAMATAMVILSTVKRMSKTATDAMLVMGIVVGEIAIILGVMAACGIEASIPSAVALSTLLLAMSAACAIVSAIPSAAALSGAIGLSEFIGVMALVALAAGLLYQDTVIRGLVEDGGEFLASIGRAIGKFVGGMVDGALIAASASLPTLADNLTSFMDRLSGFITTAQSITPESMEGIKTLAGAILAFTAADFLNGITSLFEVFTGSSDINTFQKAMAEMGSGILSFATKIKTLRADDIARVTEAAPAVKSLTEALASMPNSGGVVGWFMGENNDYEGFGNGLCAIADGIIAVYDKIRTLPEDANETVNAFASTLEALSNAMTKIPNEGGWIDTILGGNDAKVFTDKLPSVAGGIKQFITNLGEFDKSKVEYAKNAADCITAIAKGVSEIPTEGGWIESFAGSSGLGSFITSLPEIAKNINLFTAKLSNIDDAKVKNANNAITIVRNLAGLSKELNGIDFGPLSNLDIDLGEIATNGIDAFIGAFTNSGDKITGAGEGMLDNLVSGLEDTDGSLDMAGETLVGDLVDVIESEYSDFKDAGAYVVEGFADGITSQTWEAEAKARAMAKAAFRAAAVELDVNSPSKEFYKLGSFSVEGFVNAFIDLQSRALAAGSGIAKYAMDGLTRTISSISDALNSDIDSQPVIRPVLDLSEVHAGASAINGMLGMSPSVGVLRNVSSINSMMNRRQNGANSDVVSAISDLGRKLGNRGGDVYNINGVNVSGDEEVANAFKVIVRKATVERRR